MVLCPVSSYFFKKFISAFQLKLENSSDLPLVSLLLLLQTFSSIKREKPNFKRIIVVK